MVTWNLGSKVLSSNPTRNLAISKLKLCRDGLYETFLANSVHIIFWIIIVALPPGTPRTHYRKKQREKEVKKTAPSGIRILKLLITRQLLNLFAQVSILGIYAAQMRFLDISLGFKTRIKSRTKRLSSISFFPTRTLDFSLYFWERREEGGGLLELRK